MNRTTIETAAPYLPDRLSLKTMREAVDHCRGCDLYKDATQAVFGEGPKSATLMVVGETPGDQEDKQGRPFVGPAGRMLDEALADVGIDRKKVFVTNAVKHFKYTMRGKRRLHGKPSGTEVRACRPWLNAEVEVVKPHMLVALGATAAQSMFGSTFRVTQRRGEPFESDWAPWCMATVHPSSLLRHPTSEERAEAWEAFVNDFRVVAKQYASLTNGG